MTKEGMEHAMDVSFKSLQHSGVIPGGKPSPEPPHYAGMDELILLFEQYTETSMNQYIKQGGKREYFSTRIREVLYRMGL